MKVLNLSNIYSLFIPNKWPDIKEILWFIYGLLAFVPFEFLYDGLWLAYIQIAIIFCLSAKIKMLNVWIFFTWTAIVIISTLMSDFTGLQTLVNPIFTGLMLIAGDLKRRTSQIILNGIYTSALIYTFYMIYLALELDITSLFILMSSREWALDRVVGFGNGLAILFALVMIFSFKQKKYIMMMLFFIGGIFTTSRIPFIALTIIILGFFYNSTELHIKIRVITTLVVLLTAALATDVMPNESEFIALEARFSTTDDRVDVYNLAWKHFEDNPFLGIGGAKLPEYDHAHNSYVQVLTKYGVIGFLIWILMWYVAYLKNINIKENLNFMLIFLIISTSQIGLQNPNALILIILYRWIFIESKFKH
jgi:O-antigen ligase